MLQMHSQWTVLTAESLPMPQIEPQQNDKMTANVQPVDLNGGGGDLCSGLDSTQQICSQLT